MHRSMRAMIAGIAVAISVAGPAQAHNAAHLILPDGTCLDVGSNREAPFVGQDRFQLDLIVGPGDQYGARYAATRSPRLLAGNC